MAGHTSTMTSKGQVTVPAEVRRYMNLEQGDRLLFVREAGRVYIDRLPAESSSAQVYGVLRRAGVAPLDVEQARVDAREHRRARHGPSEISNGQGQRIDGR